jgi:glyoxylase-like metal-dependent hydrolase (beta-lactamase superfamily II)
MNSARNLKIHAINTGSVTIRPNQVEGKGGGLMRTLNVYLDKRWTEALPIYAWAIEHPEGVVVIDTGETARTAERGYFPRWHPYYRNLKTDVKPEQEIGPQLEEIGIKTNEVRQVILTHMHTDHAGGLYHFPKSEIVIMKKAYDLARGFRGMLRGFIPHRLPSWLSPKLIDLSNEGYGPFPKSLKMTKAGDIILVLTSGHTEAHISVILETPDVKYFFAGDTSYNQDLMLRGKIDGVSAKAKDAYETIQNIQRFTATEHAIYLPSHDPDSEKRLVNNEVTVPTTLISDMRNLP